MRTANIKINLLPALLLLALPLLSACEAENHKQTQGREIFPPRGIEYAALWQLNGPGINPAFFRDQWSLVIIEDAVCQRECLQRLALIAAISNVQRLLVAADAATHKQMRNIANHNPGVEVAMGTTAASIDSFRRQLSGEDREIDETLHPVYVISPDAEVVLTYPGNGETEGLQKEVNRLRGER